MKEKKACYKSVRFTSLCLVLFGMFMFSLQVHAQQLESEKHIKKLELAKTIDDSLINYQRASVYASREGNFEKAQQYAEKMLSVSKRTNKKTGVANAYFCISDSYFNRDQNDTAKYYAQKCLDAYDAAGKKGIYYTYALNAIAAYYLDKGDAANALAYGQKQMDAAVEVKDTASISNSYTMLCAIYEMLGDTKNSIKYAEKALELNRLIDAMYNRAIVLTNLASLYTKDGQNKRSLPLLYESMQLMESQTSSKVDRARSYMLLGSCYTELGNIDSANKYMQKADKLANAAEKPEDAIKTWILFAKMYATQKNYKAALLYLDKSDTLAKEKKLVKLYSNSTKVKSDILAEQGNYQDAYQYLQEYNTIDDSLTNASVQGAIADIREKYESDKKDEHIAQQKRDNKYLSIGIAIALALAALILFQYIRQRQATRIIRKQSDKLTLLMKELHHRVKNNLQIISSLLSLQSFRIKDAAAAKAVREGQQRIEAMSLIHQRLYTRDNITEINIKEFISDLVDSPQSAYGFRPDDISVHLSISDELMNVDQAIPLSLIVNELVTNAFKYAYKDNDKPELSINLNRDKDSLHLIVADNGKGVNMEEWKDKEGSFGKELIATFVKQLKGYLSIVVDSGTKFKLSIPNAA